MIVFTAKNKVTGEVFVGSARESVEENWAQLIVKAEEQGTGDILDAIRTHQADSFEVETWGYGDSAADARELIKDACEVLNAQVIKTGRAPSLTAQDIHADEKKTVELRQAGSTKDYQDIKDLMVKIEMKRKENRKTAPVSSVAKKASTKSSATKKTPSTQAKHTKVVNLNDHKAKDKLPEGRVGSSSKEKRIREAIAKEKLEREAKKAAQIAEQADEMAAILAKLDSKTKEKAKYLRRK